MRLTKSQLHTPKGDLKILLLSPQLTPKTSYNFLAHCASGTYDNTNIVRDIPGFIIQFGDPTNTGKDGESIWGGLIPDEIINFDTTSDDSSTSGKSELRKQGELLKFDKRGMVGMAKMKSGGNGSQFFITFDKLSQMDGKYTIFGQVVESEEERLSGTSTLSKLEAIITDKKGRVKSEKDKLGIKGVTIHANPFAENLVRSK
ncbi:hypothetical protein WICPIJ_007916 [Wickerhamomyces pijperi]|uniref:Peptidyl-prolyl cis-trans isomerase n=1 Tax=Wickerhamomyces pijperi TaxID=599730 RepID=A0A9P8TJZ8_WICPI|nr:hypothetical protein WICPIJ_007916 [Wickerhamomyces pijperi]